MAVLERDCWICAVCGEPAGRSAHCDHVKPHGGQREAFVDPDNLQCLCHKCHSAKTAREDGGFGNG